MVFMLITHQPNPVSIIEREGRKEFRITFLQKARVLGEPTMVKEIGNTGNIKQNNIIKARANI
jgi:hypothetical protein